MFTKEQLELAYKSYTGPVVVGVMAPARPWEKTFRNNKYSIFNRGRKAAQFGIGGVYSFVEKI